VWYIAWRHFACQKATEFSKANAGKWTGGVLAITGKAGLSTANSK